MISPDAESRGWLLKRVRTLTVALETMGAPEWALDDAVHGAASKEASETNNGGLPAQLEFLLRSGWKPEEIVKEAAEAVEENE